MTAAERVLVTGASGFIGRNALPPLIERGFEVHAVSRETVPCDAPEGVQWHRADLLVPEGHDALLALVEPTHLLHLAWYTEHPLFWHSPQNLRWAAATIHLVHAFADRGGRRAVLGGSCAEYRWGEPGRCTEGSTPLVPATLYGAAKLGTYEVLYAAAQELGLELASGRVFFVYGPGEAPDRLVASVARGLLAGERVATSDGKQIRDFLHVADAARAFVELADSAVTGPVNIGSGNRQQLRDIIDAVGRETGRAGLLDVGALPRPPNDPQELVADVSRLRAEVGFVPTVDLEDGIRQTVAWWRTRLS